MSAGAFLLLFFSLILGEENGPESFLGFHAALPAFSDDDSLNDPDLAPGLPITTVAENSPAEKAGMQVGDRVLRVGGTVPRTPEHLEAMVASAPVGSELKIALRRGGQILEVSPRTAPRLVPRAAPEARRFVEGKRLGLALTSLTAEEARKEGIPPGDGVRVERIMEGSAALGSDLKAGDVIASINGETAHGGDDFLAIARGLKPNEEVTLQVSRERRVVRVRLKTREPGSYVSRFHFPLVVIYERDPRKDETTFGLILNVFKYTRKEKRSSYRFLWFITLDFGTNEELEEVKG
jgi:S1-C subfamily serine protease